MNKFNSQRGFFIVEIVLVIAVLAIVGLLGWQFLKKQQKQTAEVDATGTSQSQAPEVKNSDDLKAAEDFLDNTDIDGALDTAEIDNALEQ